MSKVARLIGQSDVSRNSLTELSEEALKRKVGKPPPNHILLLTILDPFYPINVNVIRSICDPFGKVVRIVIFRKNGVQAMVELEDVQTATTLRDGLNDKEIYSGCCRLKVEYAKPTKLNVMINTTETWDYTKETPISSQSVVENDGNQPSDTSNPPPNYLLPNPSVETCNALVGVEVKNNTTNSCSPAAIAGAYSPDDLYGPLALVKTFEEYSDYGSVVMAYNLDEQEMSPDRVFNLFCMYGNVWKIKFLKSKKGCAMIQMGDSQSTERCLKYLQGIVAFGKTLQLGISKQPFLGDMGKGFKLPGGSNSWKDFSSSKNNRFLTPAMASRNRINNPSKVLHFFNMPPCITEERLEDFIFNSAKVRLVDISVFPNKNEKSSSGLLEFESVADSVTCILICNNVPIHGNDGGPPFFIKLCFSSAVSIAVAEWEYESKLLKRDQND